MQYSCLTLSQRVANSLRNYPQSGHQEGNIRPTPRSSPRKHQRKATWQNEQNSWKNTVDNFELAIPFRECIHPTHTLREWYFDQEGSSLQERTPHGTLFYVPVPGYHRIISRKRYIESWGSEDQPRGSHAFIKTIVTMRVSLRQTNPDMVHGPTQPS